MVFWESQHRTRTLHSAGIMECAVFLWVDGSHKIPQTPVCRINEVCVCACVVKRLQALAAAVPAVHVIH